MHQITEVHVERSKAHVHFINLKDSEKGYLTFNTQHQDNGIWGNIYPVSNRNHIIKDISEYTLDLNDFNVR